MVRALAPPLGALAANSDILASAPSIRPMAATLPGVEGLERISASVAIIDARVSGMMFPFKWISDPAGVPKIPGKPA